MILVSTMFPGGLYIVALLMIALTCCFYKRQNPKSNGVLPPGSMGWPLLGETLHFFAPTSTYDVPPFVKQRVQRFGPIFKTSVVGQPLIVSTDADLNYYIFQQEGQLFKSWYPKTFIKILGSQSLNSLDGFMHKYMKKMVLSLFGPENLKKMLPEVQEASTRKLKLWSSWTSIDLKEGIAQMIFTLTAKKLISPDLDAVTENLREDFKAFIHGLISFPLNIPGTAYHKCLKARNNAMKMLKNMLQERKGKSINKTQGDFFDFMIEELESKDTVLTEAMALDLMFALLFASYETISLALTQAVKFLEDHPLVLKELTEEHEAIIKNREDPETGLTWKEYKSMKFTFQFINETLRLANIAPGIFRKAISDIQFKGYTIPAGWPVMVCPPAVHLDDSRYKDPLDFNPWRWEGVDIHGASRNFMAFGGGMRFCVGADFAKVEMAVFLHCLVTKYRFKGISGGEIRRTPGLQFPNGFHVQISAKGN